MKKPAAMMHVSQQPPPIIHAISGSIGSAVALVFFYPLERVRIELQRTAAAAPDHQCDPNSSLCGRVNRQTNSNTGDLHNPDSFELVEGQESEGMLRERAVTDPSSLVRCIQDLWVKKSLYRGVMHNCISLSISNFCFFFVNESVKKYLIAMQQQHHQGSGAPTKLRPGQHLLASCVAGVCNVLVTNPLWVSNLQIVTEDDNEEKENSGKSTKNTGVVARLVHIARTQGMSHLWSGTSVSLLLVSNPVIQFFVYEQLKQRIQATGPLRVFWMAALAKFIATVLTYPLQLSQTALRLTDESHSAKTNNTILACLCSIYRKGGPSALFTGMRPKLLQTVLTAACTFLTYEQIVAVLHGCLLRHQMALPQGALLQRRAMAIAKR